MRGLAALCLLSGCAQLFGLDETSGDGSGIQPDASPSAVTTEVQRDSIGTTLTRTPYDVSMLTANYLVPDSSAAGFTRVKATGVGDTWSAQIPDGTPAAEITLGLDLPDVFRRLYALPQRNLKILYGIFEQEGAALLPTPPVDTLNITLNLPELAQTATLYRIYSLGSWAYHDFAENVEWVAGTTSTITATTTFGDATWGNLSGRPFTKITTGDTVVGLHYNGNLLVGAAEFPVFAQADGANAITATMADVTTQPLDVHLSPSAIAARLAMPTPHGTAVGMSWSTNASPAADLANGTGPQLNAATILTTDSGAITAPSGNPFSAKGWKTTFNLGTNSSRTYAVPGLGNFVGTFYTGLNQIAEVGPGLTMDTPAALPVLVSINSMPLSVDGNTISLTAGKSVTLSMVTDGTPDPLFYQFNIYELRENAAATALETHVAYVAVSDTTMVTVPSDVFVAGKTYFIRAHCIKGGYPSFSTGNFFDRNLPYSVGYLDAGVFTVAAQ
ncbi:MAG: hypothetical protein QM831_07140 [Kofleriaceae bacterium]